MVLKWIPATSGEVEVIGDVYLLSGCTHRLQHWMVLAPPGRAKPPQTMYALLSLQSGLNATAGFGLELFSSYQGRESESVRTKLPQSEVSINTHG